MALRNGISKAYRELQESFEDDQIQGGELFQGREGLLLKGMTMHLQDQKKRILSSLEKLFSDTRKKCLR